MPRTRIPKELSSTRGIVDNSNATAITIDVNENVGIGTSSPASSHKLTVASSIRLTGAAPAISYVETDASSQEFITGMYGGLFAIRDVTNATFPVYIETSTPTNTLRLNSTGVGIGTSSPSTKLEISGVKNTSELRLSSTTNDTSWSPNQYFGKISFYSADASGAGAGIKGSIVSAQLGGGGGTPHMAFNVSSTTANEIERMRIDSSGNVGIGTSSPSGKLQAYVSANRYQSLTGLNADLEVVSDNNSAPVVSIKGTGSADLLNVFDNTTEVFTILDGGNVGIGTSSPTNKLEVVESSTGTVNLVSLRTTGGGGQGLFLGVDTASSYTYIKNNTSSTYGMTFWTNGAERMRIASNGDVMIGSTVAPTGAGLTVNSGISSSSISAIEIQQNTTGAVKAAAALGVAIQNGGESTNAADLWFAAATGGSLVEHIRIEGGTGALNFVNGDKARLFFHRDGSGASAVYFHFKTSVPWAGHTQMYSVGFDGHDYSGATPVFCRLCWYSYGPSNAAINIGSYGNQAATCYSSSDGYLVMRVTISGGYYVAMSISQYPTNQGLAEFNITAAAHSSTANHY